jgi:hypothetical protein
MTICLFHYRTFLMLRCDRVSTSNLTDKQDLAAFRIRNLFLADETSTSAIDMADNNCLTANKLGRKQDRKLVKYFDLIFEDLGKHRQ